MDKTLIVFDVGGVFRDSTEAINEGYKRGFESINLKSLFKAIDVWHLRGLGRYNDGHNGMCAILAMTEAKADLPETFSNPTDQVE